MRACRRFWALFVLVALAGLVWISVALAAPPVPPSPTSHVTDEAEVLSTSTRESLDRRLARYEQEGGHQIIVWIGRTTENVPIEDFAVEAFEQWKIGRPDLDDGLGVFAMAEDRTIRIEVGYGLEPTITDLIASRVIRLIMIPRIEQGDWDAGIVTGVEALVDTIEGTPGSLPADLEKNPALDGRGHEWSPLDLALLIIGIVVFMILMVTNPRLALGLLFLIGRGALSGGGGGREDSGFGGLGGRSGGGGATGRW